jgi:hypothetical protein
MVRFGGIAVVAARARPRMVGADQLLLMVDRAKLG